jgi:hypothetical protein
MDLNETNNDQLERMINSSAYDDYDETLEQLRTEREEQVVKQLILSTDTCQSLSIQKKDNNINTNVPIIYSNSDDNIDMCISCYQKVSDTLKKKLMLIPGYKRSGSDYYWCDACKSNIFVGDGPETKLQVLLKLKDLNLSVDSLVNSCQSNPWNSRIDLLYSELKVGGMLETLAREVCVELSSTNTEVQVLAESITLSENACDSSCNHKICNDSGRLDSSLITVDVCEHLVTCESNFRKRSSTQEFHVFMRENHPSLLAEDAIQRNIMISHGIKSPVSDKELYEYRKQVSKFTHLPHIREKGFFLKNNILKEGCSIGSDVPLSMRLYNYNTDHSESQSTLGSWLNKASEEDKTLVVFSGSIT